MRKREIRFAIGELGDQLSPVWKIWHQKNDVYLTGKFTGGAFKFSLHASGKWIFAATSESGLEIKPGNRRMKTWQRPPEFADGWTWGPHIAVPRLPQFDHAKLDEKQTKLVQWLPAPQPLFKATISVIFASADKTAEDIGFVSMNGDAYLHDYLELQNKQKVFVRIRYEPLTPADMPTLGYIQSQADEWIAVNDDIVGCLALFMQAAEVPYVYVLKFAAPPKA
ncbi:hypothetical protein A5761_02890 [Mycolicibacterium setense]|uniref:hypothetical protein n=1 Tax=Mycolicibacterium setense TaxID=431269 RepID=UPI0007EB16AB|nr:hypothetical protein [Mycolicibacterium setense]OBB21072.1 hypothetical protein A5761_02890 [Mycolicibacterium setense]